MASYANKARARKNTLRKSILVKQDEILQDIEENEISVQGIRAKFRVIEEEYNEYLDQVDNLKVHLQSYEDLEALLRVQTEQKRLHKIVEEADDASDLYIKVHMERDERMSECDEDQRNDSDEEVERERSCQDTIQSIEVLQEQLKGLLNKGEQTGISRRTLFKPRTHSTPMIEDNEEPVHVVRKQTGHQEGESDSGGFVDSEGNRWPTVPSGGMMSQQTQSNLSHGVQHEQLPTDYTQTHVMHYQTSHHTPHPLGLSGTPQQEPGGLRQDQTPLRAIDQRQAGQQPPRRPPQRPPPPIPQEPPVHPAPPQRSHAQYRLPPPLTPQLPYRPPLQPTHTPYTQVPRHHQPLSPIPGYGYQPAMTEREWHDRYGGRVAEGGMEVTDLWGYSGGHSQQRGGYGVQHLSQRQREYGDPSIQPSGSYSREGSLMLERIQVPVFEGNKRDFEHWWTEYMGLVHTADIPIQQKMMRLRRALKGDAKTAVGTLTDSIYSYDMALDILWETYGGSRRQLNMRLEDVESIRQVRDWNAEDLARLMSVLNVLMVKMREDGHGNELGYSTLYFTIQRKIDAALLRRYFSWIRDHGMEESVVSLRQFMAEESRSATYAQEVTKGLGTEKRTEKGTDKGSDRKKKEFRSRTLHTAAEPATSDRGKWKCRVCQETHGIWKCPKFKEMPVGERWAKAKEYFLCFRCLGTQHKGELCKYSRKCGVNGCSNTHHQLLHDTKGTYQSKTTGAYRKPAAEKGASPGPPHQENKPAAERGKEDDKRIEKGITQMSRHSHRREDFVALRTVPVVLCGASKTIKVHALLDDASTKTYINREVVAELGLQEEDVRLTVKVLNNMSTVLDTSVVQVSVRSLKGDFTETVDAYTTENVTGDMMVVDWNQYKEKWDHLADIPFPRVGRGQKVDILLGANCLKVHEPEETRAGVSGAPVARRTPLGWTCIGAIPQVSDAAHTNFVFHQRHEPNIEDLLKRFWEIEEPPPCEVVRPEDQHAVNVAQTTMSYKDGRYCIGVPWKLDAKQMPNNYNMAYSRLQSTERRLLREPKLAVAYCGVIKDYLEKGYIVKLEDSQEVPVTGHLLPHFPVYKEGRATTKCRVVYDGSAKTSGIALNDIICQGPKLQADLVTVLYHFREKLIAITCDISEMYLQVLLKEGDRRFHRFLWRDMKFSDKAALYEFTRWVFGVNASPFAVQYVVKKNAERYQKQYPIAAKVVKKSTYMDDGLPSVDSVDEGEELYRQVTALWMKASMKPGKWISNSEELMRRIPEAVHNVCVNLDAGELGTTKTLGVVWDPQEDIFTYKVEKICGQVPSTKRGFLSSTAMLFDPLGLVAPVTAVARMLLQKMWMAGVGWDDVLPADIQDDVSAWFQALPGLEEIKVPRACKLAVDVVKVQLHTFCDASIDAYGAIVYVRNTYADGAVSTHVLRAKVKVAPVTSTSVPRLELMAAVVGARLATHAGRELEIDSAECYFWSDSVDVLFWVRGQSRKFRPFVANRVGEIQRLSAPASWSHIGTKQNPADVLSRGSSPEELRQNDLWWKGPSFLSEPPDTWPHSGPQLGPAKNASEVDTTFLADGKRGVRLGGRIELCHVEKLRLDPHRFSSWNKLLRVGAYVLRFISNCRKATVDKSAGALQPEEISDVAGLFIQIAQRDGFPDEFKALHKMGSVRESSRIIKFAPYLDEIGTIRVGGRLEASDCLHWEEKHPVVLPRHHDVTQLIVKNAHEQAGHAGTNKTLAVLTQKFWVVAAREEIRSWENKCMFCRRRNKQPFEQKMGSLPAARISKSLRPFDYSSVDYAGPFLTRQGRGKAKAKRYLCVFACMNTRAVHLELSYAMDTASFLNALTRMVSRRGVPTEIVSDNGSNFIGATRELRDLVDHLDSTVIQNDTVTKGIRWKFNPPSAPHFNGVHEAMVKSAKRSLKMVLADADIGDEELHTAICGVEALLNGRPLTYQSSDVQDERPLTPNDFLVGQVRGSFPPENVDTTDFCLRNRWRHVQKILSHFWRRWQQELLPQLNARKKWHQDKRNVQVNDIVIVVSPDNPRGKWPLARVDKVFPGPDGKVRAVDIQMGNAIYRRPVVKLCPLEGVES